MKEEKKILELLNIGNEISTKILVDKNYTKGSPVYYYLYGLIYCSKGKYSLAIEAFKKVEILGVNSFTLYYNLSTAYIENFEYDLAEFYLKKAIKINNKHVLSYINLAHVYYMKNMLHDAYRTIKKGLANTDASILHDIELKLVSLLK